MFWQAMVTNMLKKTHEDIIGSNNLSFVTMGRLSPEKDHEKLLYAFSKFLEKYPASQLYIIGSGPLEEYLVGLADQLGIAGSATFCGQLVNPFPVLVACDAFVLSSNYEGQMVLLEALALGLPVIATDIVGNRSVLGSNYGDIVDNSVEGLVQGMQLVANGEYNRCEFDGKAYEDESANQFHDKVLNFTLLSAEPVAKDSVESDQNYTRN